MEIFKPGIRFRDLLTAKDASQFFILHFSFFIFHSSFLPAI